MKEPFEKIEIIRRGDKTWIRVIDMQTGVEGDWQKAAPRIPQIIDAVHDSPEWACGVN